MKWDLPPKIKIYEALGAVADGRIEVEGDSAKVYSSSKGKFYTVTYDASQNAIMCNDNASYWKGYLGYPAIAVLMVKGILAYDKKFSEALKGILWKDINAIFKNDFDKTQEYVDNLVTVKSLSLTDFHDEVDAIFEQIKKLDLDLLGTKVRPPQGY